MNALSLYLSTCRYVMSADIDNKESWGDLYRYLPYLRQALSCCVCRNILIKPMGPTHNVCQHFVCHGCIGGKMKLKPQCSWCRDHSDFKENIQLRIVVVCFQKLCEYIHNSFIGTEISSVNTPNGEKNNLMIIIQEALEIKEDFKFSSSINLPGSNLILDKIKFSDSKTNEPKLHSDTCAKESRASTSTPRNTTMQKVPLKWRSRRKKFTSYRHKILKKKSIQNHINHKTVPTKISQKSEETKRDINSRTTINANEIPVSGSKMREHNSEIAVEKKLLHDSFIGKADNSALIPPLKKPKLIPADQNEIRICKCGRGGQNSRLTCLGQRCPCYIKRLPCIGCKCRGCRNPRKAIHLEPPLLIQESFRTVNSDQKNFLSVTS